MKWDLKTICAEFDKPKATAIQRLKDAGLTPDAEGLHEVDSRLIEAFFDTEATLKAQEKKAKAQLIRVQIMASLVRAESVGDKFDTIQRRIVQAFHQSTGVPVERKRAIHRALNDILRAGWGSGWVCG